MATMTLKSASISTASATTPTTSELLSLTCARPSLSRLRVTASPSPSLPSTGLALLALLGLLRCPALTQHNTELSGYGQDRWLLAERVFLEAGLRYDWDQLVRRSVFSPRLAATWGLDTSGT